MIVLNCVGVVILLSNRNRNDKYVMWLLQTQKKSALQKMSRHRRMQHMALLHGFLAPLQLQRKRVLFTTEESCFHAGCTTFYPNTAMPKNANRQRNNLSSEEEFAGESFF